MLLHTSNTIFDTLVDTRKIYGAMRTRFSLRKDVQVDGKCPIYLNIGGNEVRINLKIYIDPAHWLRDKRRAKALNQELTDINLALDVIEGKLTSIKTTYRLTETILTPQLLADEYLCKLSRVNFVAFFKEALEQDKINLTEGTYDRHHSVYMKLKEFNPNIAFHEINLNWINKFKTWLKTKKKNLDTTISANLASIKKFLGIAEKHGVKLALNLSDIEVGSTRGNRTYLNETELKKCFDYYSSNFINDSNKLILGYFLFSCMTGLRISNVQKLCREELQEKDIQLIMVKGNKDRTLSLNAGAKKVIEECEALFIKKFADQHINDELKKIMPNIGITKKISFHCARHTFATLFLKMGGKVEMLKELLGHSSINQTMIYVHIVQADANKEIFLLDNLFKTD